jgi:hypothetical protein
MGELPFRRDAMLLARRLLLSMLRKDIGNEKSARSFH